MAASSASTSPTEPPKDSATPPEGLSAFAARVLDQLSVSAWLPAALLVAGLFLLVKVRYNDGAIMEALADVGNTKGGTIVLLAATVVVLTTVTQALEFGAIRVLEGYWGRRRLASSLARRCSNHQTNRLSGIEKKRRVLMREAFESARHGLLNARVSPEAVEYLPQIFATSTRFPHSHPRSRQKRMKSTGGSMPTLSRCDSSVHLIDSWIESHGLTGFFRHVLVTRCGPSRMTPMRWWAGRWSEWCNALTTYCLSTYRSSWINSAIDSASTRR